MATMADIVESYIISEAGAEVQPGATQADDSTIETQLAKEISTLWTQHVRLSSNRKTTAKELRLVRAHLAERLAAMKAILSRPGRGGQWRGWLKQQNIPRSTADRLVSRHAETLGADHEENVPTGAISDSPKESAEKLAKAAWPRIKKVLTTDESVFQFLASIAEVSGVPHERREEGLMVFNPVPKAADELPVSTSATDPASQPCDEASAITAEPAGEAATATPAFEQPAGEADVCAEAVA